MPRPGPAAGYGGVGLLHKTGISVKIAVPADKCISFEHMECSLLINSWMTMRLAVIYIPPPSQSNQLKTSTFMEEWPVFLGEFLQRAGKPVVVGDVNLHLDNPGNAATMRFNSVIETYGITQHVTDATHTRGHTLDMLLTCKGDNILDGDVTVSDPGLGDHYAVHCGFCLQKPKPIRQQITYRKLSAISPHAFEDDILGSGILTSLNNDDMALDTMVSLYETILSALVDKHAPLSKKTITLRPHSPWHTDELQKAKQTRRKLERTWQKSWTPEDHRAAAYREYCSVVNELIRTCRSDYYSQKIAECGKDQRALSKITNPLLGRSKNTDLPEYKSSACLADTFNLYFIDKVANIRKNLAGQLDVPEYTGGDPGLTAACMSRFNPFAEDEVLKLVNKTPSKSCQLDPLPTGLLKVCS